MPEMAREYTRVGGQMETAKKQRTARLNPGGAAQMMQTRTTRPHGADRVWQACYDASQRAQAAGPRPDDILVGRLAAEAPRSGVDDAS